VKGHRGEEESEGTTRSGGKEVMGGDGERGARSRSETGVGETREGETRAKEKKRKKRRKGRKAVSSSSLFFRWRLGTTPSIPPARPGQVRYTRRSTHCRLRKLG